MEKKPIELWLFLWGIVVGLIVYLAPQKTPSVILVCLVIMFLLLAIPLWNFWWIEKAWWRRLFAYATLASILFFYGQLVWPSKPDSCIQFLKLTYQVGASPQKIITYVNNCSGEIPANAVAYLGFQKPEKKSFFWIPSKTKLLYPISNGEIETFSFEMPPSPFDKGSLLPLVLQSENFENGMVHDARYTWDYLESMAPTRGNAAFVDPDQITDVKGILEETQRCLKKHSKDKNYSQCFPAD